MPNAELSEILFIAMMFFVVIIISTVSIYLFVRQFKREKGEAAAQKQEKHSQIAKKEEVKESESET
jgi:flagellar basal body-associated protein FliL